MSNPKDKAANIQAIMDALPNTCNGVAHTVGLSKAWVYRIVKQLEKEGYVGVKVNHSFKFGSKPSDWFYATGTYKPGDKPLSLQDRINAPIPAKQITHHYLFTMYE